MGFKEMLFEDIKNIFLNVEEFGEIHTINQKEMLVVIDEMELTERSKKQIESGRIDGIYKRQILLYVARKDFGKMPAIGSNLNVDSSKWRVADVSNEGGVYSITLGSVSS